MRNANRLLRIDRRAAVLGGLAAGLALPWTALAKGPDGGLAAPEPIEIAARPILHFERGRPEARRFGDLEFRGGLVLSSPSEHFGGCSGLVLEADGNSLLAISDVGSWLTADVAYDGVRPSRLANARIGPLLNAAGKSLGSKREQDAEAVALLEGTLARGTLLVGFERHHRIERFEIRDRQVRAPSGAVPLPADARRMRPNQGIEALAVLRGGPNKGAIVGFAERLTGGSGYHTGWIWIKGEPRRLQLRDIDGYNVTDAASLPDGGLLVLERYFRWTEGVKMRIRRVAAGEIAPGAKLEGRVVMEADSGFDIDNMEGLAVHRGSRGETVVSLISDDNFNHFLQRTIFLQFTLLDDRA